MWIQSSGTFYLAGAGSPGGALNLVGGGVNLDQVTAVTVAEASSITDALSGYAIAFWAPFATESGTDYEVVVALSGFSTEATAQAALSALLETAQGISVGVYTVEVS
jgi:hypothetical protein